MSKNFTGARIKAEKDKIIAMYQRDIPILDIAREYGVVSTSLWRHLKRWGVKVTRKKRQPRMKIIKCPKRVFSPELQAIMKENTRINDKYIKRCEFERATEDQKLVANIIRHPIIG